MYRVCFVCTGNICRSPMAEAVFRARVAEAGFDGLVGVSSAGTGSWHVGEGADPRTLAVLAAAGYPELDHAAQQFDAHSFARHDLVVALDEGHAAELRALARNPAEAAKVRLLRSYDPEADPADREVPDPYYGGPGGFDVCLDLVEAAMPGLLVAVRDALDLEGARE
ncbi:low molecular weight protein-tyrosine-phosphatase [Streptomyces boncukensis]|uniref:protein-tyrosine-phosphatase n=1 Tax=Streptomyces boncukensis TaxID=2711219 RepID=A0A6G4X554_9ACTN|nr:low molecular weight protein-tyrosine-phosphatase [Streptomyces boncukensis]NGO71864.1 low molecular weight phosphotyrosine protein phosphatase [Streptomyces boncukensis]